MADFNRQVVLHERFREVAAVFAAPVGCLALVCGLATAALAQHTEIPLTAGSVLRFADVREGVQALTARDDYIQQLSPFDRQVRTQADGPVSEEQFLAFVSTHVKPWSSAEIEKLTPYAKSLAEKIAPWKLSLPPVVWLVKTDGREEGGAAYCRGSAIVLPQNIVDGSAGQINQILPHELFHILSSHNPALREQLYATIGFHPCNEVALPELLRPRKITNPDAPVIRHYISVEQNGNALELMPVLLSKSERYDPVRKGSLFAYLDFKLMQLENAGGTRQPAIVNGQPVLWDPAKVPGFLAQVGNNTKYLIHPEEILADNFVFLINGRLNLPTQRVVQQLGAVLQAYQPMQARQNTPGNQPE